MLADSSPGWLGLLYLIFGTIISAGVIIASIRKWGKQTIKEIIHDELDSDHHRDKITSIVIQSVDPKLEKIHERIDNHMVQEEEDLRRMVASNEEKASALTSLSIDVAYLRGVFDQMGRDKNQ